MKVMIRIVAFLLLLASPAGAQVLRDSVERLPCAAGLAYTIIDMPTCEMTLLVGGSAVITTESDLRERFRRFASTCDTNRMPVIDFETYSLIGRWITLGNCPAGKRFGVYVCRDDDARAYRHVVTIAEHWCRGTSSYMSWILVPKLPEGYTVSFEGGRW